MSDWKELSLDPVDWGESAALGHRAVKDVIQYLGEVRDRPVWQAVPVSVRRRFEEPLPWDGLPANHVYDEFCEFVRPYNYGNIHPRFWGWVNGTGTVLTVLAEFLAASMNPNCYGGDCAPYYLERQTIDWLKELLGFPTAASGLLTSGGSISNFVALAVALEAQSNGAVRTTGLFGLSRPMVLYASEETHHSIVKAARLLGLGEEGVRTIPVDREYAIDVGRLRDAIASDRELGREPFCVVGNAGTVRTGAFDPLRELADVCAEENLWFHVDGAFGAFVAASDRLAPLARGLDRADSLAFDLHKWMYMPIGVGCVLIADSVPHRAAFRVEASYLGTTQSGLLSVDEPFGDFGPELTREFRALKVWMGIKEHGARKYVRAIEQNVDQARYLAESIEREPDLELLAPVPLNIICFRFVGDGTVPEQNARNRELLIALQTQGIAVLSPMKIGCTEGLRVAITNHRTRTCDLDLLLRAIKAKARN